MQKRHYACVMAFLALSAGMVMVLSHINRDDETVRYTTPPSPLAIVESTELKQYERSLPTRLTIPKINLDTTFTVPLGLSEDTTVEVPLVYDKVGWYEGGVSPGEVGPAVILGHVDSYEGPAVFFKLIQLEEGDEVRVERADGTLATFVVTGTERVLQSEFPTQNVYGSIDFPGLRLVTCTGIYDHGDLRYSHNFIVYAELKND